MHAKKAVPGFGKQLRTPEFYAQTDEIIRALRPMSTLRRIAEHLNNLSIPTASGLTWNRERVSQYVRHRKLQTNFTDKE